MNNSKIRTPFPFNPLEDLTNEQIEGKSKRQRIRKPKKYELVYSKKVD